MRHKLHQNIVFVALTLSIFTPLTAFSWGQRAHHTICDAAVFLVKEPGLKAYLQNKPNMMGHLCNVPDIYWKSLGSDARKFGDAAHFIDVEVLGLPVNLIPTSYHEIIHRYTGSDNKFEIGPILSVPDAFGSNWWRADQFFRRALEAGKSLATTPVPANPKEETDNNFPFNKIIFDFTTNIGLIGHFVGDNSQPFHLSADYDGYHAGHGGIHAYYEDNLVAVMAYDLQAKVVREGLRLQKLRYSKNQKAKAQVKFLTEKTVVEKMRALGELSFADIPKILKLDSVIKKSEYKAEKGMTLKTPATRKPAQEVVSRFEPLIVLHMGRAAALLAQLWDEAYLAIGSPKIVASKSYAFPMTPDFVMPDYYDIEKEKSESK